MGTLLFAVKHVKMITIFQSFCPLMVKAHFKANDELFNSFCTCQCEEMKEQLASVHNNLTIVHNLVNMHVFNILS